LTPLADLGLSPRQAPLHRHYAASVAAGGDDAEIGASLFKRCGVNVRALGRRLDICDLLRTTCERVLEEASRTFAALGLCCR